MAFTRTHSFLCLISVPWPIFLANFLRSSTLIYCIPTPFPTFSHWFPALRIFSLSFLNPHPDCPHPLILTLITHIPIIPTLISHIDLIPNLIAHIPFIRTMTPTFPLPFPILPSLPAFSRHFVPWLLIQIFTDSHFLLLTNLLVSENWIY